MPLQCELREMAELAEAAQPVTDTLPKPGRVNEVCREWLVKEDGALAYRLQNEESPVVAQYLEDTVCAELRQLRVSVERLQFRLERMETRAQIHYDPTVQHHYTGNKSRNALVREDFPRALDAQREEEQEAEALRTMYYQMIHQQEQIDAEVAKQLAEKMEREEMERKRALEEKDKEIAHILQPTEVEEEHDDSNTHHRDKTGEERERLALEQKASQEVDNKPQYDLDMNNVGLPSPSQYSPESLSNQFRLCTLSDAAVQTNTALHSPDGEQACSAEPPSPPALTEEEARRLQEEQDAELARMLQEQEGSTQDQAYLNQDRLMAIEAQDKELARLLQERERAKARRARERAKQKALMKKQQQQQHVSEDEGFVTTPSSAQNHIPQSSEWINQNGELAVPLRTAVRPTDLDLTSPRTSRRGRQKFPDPEAIEVLSSPEPGSSVMTNIAMAIDPTYPRRATVTQTSSYTNPYHSSGATSLNANETNSNMSSPAVSLPPPGEFEDDDSPVPPYMPIQGQRRTASLEKKSIKKGRTKDGSDIINGAIEYSTEKVSLLKRANQKAPMPERPSPAPQQSA